MTLEETAKIFSEKWNKDINRTHIASAKRMAQNLFNNEIQSVLDHTKTGDLGPNSMGLGGGIGPNPGGIMSRGPTDQNRNNEILNHNYDSINERKISHEEQFNSGIDLYSQFNLNNQKQVITIYPNKKTHKFWPISSQHIICYNRYLCSPNQILNTKFWKIGSTFLELNFS